ncbi:MAG: hypothetical protein JRF41_08540 [Deltaproteobacteria bacterium]|nr:hypothetical protein [Deltaproteobacteria bacterium]
MDLLRIHESDNVAVALRELKQGETVSLPWGGSLTIKEDIPTSHKVSLEAYLKEAGFTRTASSCPMK